MTQKPDAQARIPIAEALPGVRLHALEEADEILYCYAVVKYRDRGGEETWSYRTSGAPNLEELLGVLTVQAALVRDKLLDAWQEE